MLTIRALLRCVREGDWFTSLDLKYGYHDTMTVINHLSFLGFAINWEKSLPLPGRQIV